MSADHNGISVVGVSLRSGRALGREGTATLGWNRRYSGVPAPLMTSLDPGGTPGDNRGGAGRANRSRPLWTGFDADGGTVTP